MTTFLSKSVVLTIATLLALPSGWCCSIFTHDTVGVAPAKSKCCQHSGPAQSGEKLPAAPEIECCCSHDAAIPVKVVELPDTPSIALLAVLDLGATSLGSEHVSDSAVSLIDPGPKLHVLQCEWRC